MKIKHKGCKEIQRASREWEKSWLEGKRRLKTRMGRVKNVRWESEARGNQTERERRGNERMGRWDVKKGIESETYLSCTIIIYRNKNIVCLNI